MNHPFWHEIRNELQPFDGRLATAWRLGVICALTAMVFMIWQLPWWRSGATWCCSSCAPILAKAH
ncbi:hypothetical protein [Neopusillimonas aromaticivorans]|uniref:hypothetical protein n=1 Tax=Neopusillimonas aromaticivorans TaxID=2979868 RepID=UPI0025995AE6|nr:hypothetical protein [Neopusillimonas aromaticivorans]WJJ94283.1 hypothetical protein N7E01_04350 [Neopusillimonas aromaticivorans]